MSKIFDSVIYLHDMKMYLSSSGLYKVISEQPPEFPLMIFVSFIYFLRLVRNLGFPVLIFPSICLYSVLENRSQYPNLITKSHSLSKTNPCLDEVSYLDIIFIY